MWDAYGLFFKVLLSWVTAAVTEANINDYIITDLNGLPGVLFHPLLR